MDQTLRASRRDQAGELRRAMPAQQRRWRSAIGLVAACTAFALTVACTPETPGGGTSPTTTTPGNGWEPGDDSTSFIEGDPGDAPDLDIAPDVRAMALAATNPGLATITRAQIKTRAESWLNNRAITYSQHANWKNEYGTYRKDCSGFVSMALGLTSSLHTGSLPSVGVPVAWADLRPGDFVNRSNIEYPSNGHVQLFMGWTDASKTAFTFYHQHGSNIVNGQRVSGWPEAGSRTVANAKSQGYKPFRYRHVVGDSPAPGTGDPINPVGALDVVQGGVGAAGAIGWALDMDNPNAAVQVQIRSDGDLVHTATAGLSRPDVGAAFQVPSARGFQSLWTSTPGTHTITATAVNIGAGTNVVIGTKTVVVSGPTPSGSTGVGAGYEGPGYVCSPSGATGTFFSAQQFMGANYPAGSWRQVGPSRTGAPNTLTLYDNGLPLTVPLGSICDARRDPADPNRTNKVGFAGLNPVPAGYSGAGYICNAGGSYGRNGSNGQLFFATYAGLVGPWTDTHDVAVTFNGQPWLVPRMDVCALPAMPVVGAGYEGPGYVCAVGGVDAEFFGAVKHLDFGYPLDGWRQIGPQIFGDPATHAFVEAGTPMKVRTGTICDARRDPMNAGRTAKAGFGNLTPVAAGFSGSGYICNHGGSVGRNGANLQAFFPGYRGQVGPWDANNVAVTYNGTPWLVPRPDVCA